MIILPYIHIYIYSSCHLIVGVFARKMHSTSKFAMTVLSKCVRFLLQRSFSVVKWPSAEGLVCRIPHLKKGRLLG